jgi:hypothetical protein
MSRSIVVVVLVFLCPSWLSATSESAISGQITDLEGAVVANARVLVHWDSSGSAQLKDNIAIKEDVTVLTDASGHYSAKVPTGFRVIGSLHASRSSAGQP